MPVVALTGKARHGKDTTAKALKKLLEAKERTVLIVGFADELRDLCDTLFGKELQERTDDEYTTFFDENVKNVEVFPGMTGGKLLQQVGGFLRGVYPDYWVDRFQDRYLGNLNSRDWVLIKDCRYLNEERFVRAWGGAVLRCMRNVIPDPARDASHHSETEQERILADYGVDNNQAIEELPTLLSEFFTSKRIWEMEALYGNR